MKRKLLTLSTIVLSAGVAMGDAVPLAGQVYSSDSEYAGMGYFVNVQFKSNAYEGWTLDNLWEQIDTYPGYDPESKNLLDDANNFSISLEITELLELKSYEESVTYPDFSFISSAGEAQGIWVGLTFSETDQAYRWAITQNENGSPKSHLTTGSVYDGLGGTYIFRSGTDFMDLWRVVEGKAELLVTHNEALDGALYGYMNSRGFGDYFSDIVIGQEHSNYLTSDQITSATLYNGLYNANGVGGGASSESVPEPTTATLSLLALAGLAARRRR